jgi:hypothetical protein
MYVLFTYDLFNYAEFIFFMCMRVDLCMCVKLMFGLFVYVQHIYVCMVYLFVCFYLHAIYF